MPAFFATFVNNSLAPHQFRRWSNAVTPEQYDYMRTTMTIEVHWKTLRFHFFNKVGRSRLDKIVYILIRDVIPYFTDRAVVLESRAETFPHLRRMGGAYWRLAFYKAWKDIYVGNKKWRERHPQGDLMEGARVSLQNFTSTCQYQRTSRFLRCSHIVHRASDTVALNDHTFFLRANRSSSHPFLQ